MTLEESLLLFENIKFLSNGLALVIFFISSTPIDVLLIYITYVYSSILRSSLCFFLFQVRAQSLLLFSFSLLVSKLFKKDRFAHMILRVNKDRTPTDPETLISSNLSEILWSMGRPNQQRGSLETLL